MKLVRAKSEEGYKSQEEYQNTDKIVKMSAKQDNRKYIESIADEAENAIKHGDYRTVYQITNKLCGAHTAQNIPVTAKKAMLLKLKRNN